MSAGEAAGGSVRAGIGDSGRIGAPRRPAAAVGWPKVSLALVPGSAPGPTGRYVDAQPQHLRCRRELLPFATQGSGHPGGHRQPDAALLLLRAESHGDRPELGERADVRAAAGDPRGAFRELADPGAATGETRVVPLDSDGGAGRDPVG